MLQITVTVETADVATYGVGGLLRVERGPAWAEFTTVALVAGQTIIRDNGGTDASTYRTRYSTAVPVVAGDYSDYSAASGGAPTTYASLDDVLGTFESAIIDPRKLARMTSLLTTATAQVIEACGHRDYFAHPATGTETWALDGDGSDTLHIHEGLVSLSLLELSFNGGLTYVPVTATDYVLRGDSPYVAEPVPDGEPSFHVRFTGFGSYVTFVPTIRAARLTGVRGWPAIPAALVESTAQRARQLAFASAGYSGGDAGGPDEYGRISPTDRFWPQSLYNFLQAERSRFMACHMGSTGDRQFTRGGS